MSLSIFLLLKNKPQEALHELGQGKKKGDQEGKRDKRITESKARQKEALHSAQT
jgi:hypothetical protein